MVVRTARRLPGFRFEVQPPPLSEVLPRMDVAVFVGFAASGPLQTPVVVEDVAHYAEIFGGDVALAWDSERGETLYAYLAPAVRSFFRNGGRRCWVVRVAGNGAATNHFHLPGLLQVDEHACTSPICVQARSEGSWSDSLEIATTLVTETLTVQEESRPSENSPPSSEAVRLTLVARHAVNTGDLLRLSFPDTEFVLLLAVRSPSNVVIPFDTSATVLWVQQNRLALPPHNLPEHVSSIERLTFDLSVRQGQESTWRIAGLGFAPGHARYWGNLPRDEDLYPEEESRSSGPPPLLWDVATKPRFPLAAKPGTATISFPFAMSLVPNKYCGAESQPETALHRDGLDRFDATLFLDVSEENAFRSLLSARAGDLLREADFLRYGGPAPRSLKGIYAALRVEEATLIAVPDAVHVSWSRAKDTPVASPVESMAGPVWWHGLPCDPPQKPTANEPPRGLFVDCDLRHVPAPHLDRPQYAHTGNTGKLTLTWNSVPKASYLLEQATSSKFVDPKVVYASHAPSYAVVGLTPGDYYYRVRAEVDGVFSEYSNCVGIRLELARRLTKAYSDHSLLVVHRALLRLCAARADLFTVLALPEHYREDDAIAHVNLLTSTGPEIGLDLSGVRPDGCDQKATACSSPLNASEMSALSYAAIYHPWLIGHEEEKSAGLRRTPPDGAACGIIARRALARGAWIAPANELLRGVVALTPPISRERRLSLQDSQVNLIRQEPQGFVALSADTLSDDPDLRPINVRRLLILLRRLALRLGASYVFEPNDDSFRRAVQRGFEAQLEYLFIRGAFAGENSHTSFQVVTSSSLNTPQSVDQGYFIVELRVAPSLPMTFLTIRLVQTGDRGLVTEVR